MEKEANCPPIIEAYIRQGWFKPLDHKPDFEEITFPNPFTDSPIKPCQKCKGKSEQLETALKLNDFYAADLRRKDAEIAMLQARIEQGSGIDRMVMCDLAFIMLEGVMAGRIKLKPEHIAEMRKAARG